MTVKRGGRGFGHTCRVSGHAGDGATGVTVPTVSGFLLENKLSSFFKDTAMTTPCTADGDLIAAWADTSGQGHHFTQATSGNRPTLKQAANGKWYALFAGSHYLDCSAYQVTDATTGVYSHGAAFQASSSASNQQLINTDTAVSGTRLSAFFLASTAVVRLSTYNGSSFVADGTGTFTANTDNYATAVVTASAVETWLNGTSDGSTAVTPVARNTSARLGAVLSSASQGLSGRIYGAVSDKTAISSGTRATWETWLASLYA